MADETDEQLLPAPPVGFQIAAPLIQKWLSIPPTQPVTFQVARQDVDNLFFAITSLSQASYFLQQTMIHQSHNRIEDANKALAESQRKNVEGDNYMRMFMAAIMAGVNHNG
jgi:hypothetical protein